MPADEIHGYLTGSAAPLYACYHRPSATARGALVLVGPFAEEKKAAQRALVEAARRFADEGWDVLRFDFAGTGDSGLDHSEVDLTTWLGDLRAVLDCQRARYPDLPLALVGLRFGAALAWQAALDSPVDQLVLWEPIVNGAAYARQNRQRSALRAQLTSGDATGGAVAEGTFDFDGFALNAALQAQLEEFDLLAGPLPQVRRLAVLQISGSPRLKKPLADLAARAEAGGLETHLDNVPLEAFWSAIGLIETDSLRDATVAWLAPGEPTPSAPAEVLPGAELAPDVRAECCSFDSGDQRCHGVLYQPTHAAPTRAAILLHGWSGYRSGPGQLLSQAARALTRAGLAVYSFDFRGRGESEWAVGEASLNSMIRDAGRAVPWILERTGAQRVTLVGLCSGGEVAIGASLSDPRIDSLALWSAPIFSGAFTMARQARRSRAALAGYVRKLFLRDTWAKLFGGRLNLKMIARAVSGGRSHEDAGVQDKAPDTETQMKAFEAFRGRLLFIYGGNDPETAPSWEFYRAFVERTTMPYHQSVVADANHNYYSLAWQAELLGTTLRWLSGDPS